MDQSQKYQDSKATFQALCSLYSQLFDSCLQVVEMEGKNTLLSVLEMKESLNAEEVLVLEAIIN